MKPFARYGIRNARQHSKLLYIQGLIGVALHSDGTDIDFPELFILCHDITSTGQSHLQHRRPSFVARGSSNELI